MPLAPNIGPRLCEPQQCTLIQSNGRISKRPWILNRCRPQARAPFRLSALVPCPDFGLWTLDFGPSPSTLPCPLTRLAITTIQPLPTLAPGGISPPICGKTLAFGPWPLDFSPSCPIVPNRRGILCASASLWQIRVQHLTNQKTEFKCLAVSAFGNAEGRMQNEVR